MSNSTATRPGMKPRPLSPHLQIYRFTPTMAMSIVHRITGVALYAGTLLVAWWLVAASTSEGAFATATGVMGSWFGILVLIGFTWALLHHLLGGVRGRVDRKLLGGCMEKHTSSQMAIATLVASVALTVLLWILILVVGA